MALTSAPNPKIVLAEMKHTQKEIVVLLLKKNSYDVNGNTTLF